MIPVINKQKLCGQITNNKKCYISYRNPKKHFMRKYQGFGISEDILLFLQKEGVKYVIIKTPNKEYLEPLESYINSNLVWYDEGKDKQKFVSIN